jgi:hypothetical protein
MNWAWQSLKTLSSSSNHPVTQFEKYFPTSWNIRTRLDKAAFQRAAGENETALSVCAGTVSPTVNLMGHFSLYLGLNAMCDFRLTVKNEYPVVAGLAFLILLQFTASCLYESALSALTYIKSNYRTHLANTRGRSEGDITGYRTEIRSSVLKDAETSMPLSR